MHKQVGDLKVGKRGIAQRGLLIRHLVLPNRISGSEKVIDFIADEISIDTYINIMDQYHPAYRASRHIELNKLITKDEYLHSIYYAECKGLHRGFSI
jgi:putative pyruvate formate lyase activating enzyme